MYLAKQLVHDAVSNLEQNNSFKFHKTISSSFSSEQKKFWLQQCNTAYFLGLKLELLEIFMLRYIEIFR